MATLGNRGGILRYGMRIIYVSIFAGMSGVGIYILWLLTTGAVLGLDMMLLGVVLTGGGLVGIIKSFSASIAIAIETIIFGEVPQCKAEKTSVWIAYHRMKWFVDDLLFRFYRKVSGVWRQLKQIIFFVTFGGGIYILWLLDTGSLDGLSVMLLGVVLSGGGLLGVFFPSKLRVSYLIEALLWVLDWIVYGSEG